MTTLASRFSSQSSEVIHYILCFSSVFQRAPLLVDGSYQSLEALPIEHLQIVFVASSSCSEDDSTTAASTTPTPTCSATLCQLPPAAKKNPSLANGYANPAPPKAHDVKAKSKKVPNKMVTAKRVAGKDRQKVKKVEMERKVQVEEEGLDAPPDGWPLRRVISIEEDHLPHLLQGGPQLLLHQLSEEEDEEEEDEAQSDIESSVVTAIDLSATPPPSQIPVLAENPLARKSRFSQAKKTPLSPRGQPVGKETQHVHTRLWCFKVTYICLNLSAISFKECDLKNLSTFAHVLSFTRRQKKEHCLPQTACLRWSWSATQV